MKIPGVNLVECRPFGHVVEVNGRFEHVAERCSRGLQLTLAVLQCQLGLLLNRRPDDLPLRVDRALAADCYQRSRSDPQYGRIWRSEERRVGKECRSRWSP